MSRLGLSWQQESVGIAAGFGVYAAQTRWNHARIVQHQNIAFSKKTKNIAKSFVFDAIFLSMQNQESRFIAFRRWILRN